MNQILFTPNKLFQVHVLGQLTLKRKESELCQLVLLCCFALFNVSQLLQALVFALPHTNVSLGNILFLSYLTCCFATCVPVVFLTSSATFPVSNIHDRILIRTCTCKSADTCIVRCTCTYMYITVYRLSTCTCILLVT